MAFLTCLFEFGNVSLGWVSIVIPLGLPGKSREFDLLLALGPRGCGRCSRCWFWAGWLHLPFHIPPQYCVLRVNCWRRLDWLLVYSSFRSGGLLTCSWIFLSQQLCLGHPVPRFSCSPWYFYSGEDPFLSLLLTVCQTSILRAFPWPSILSYTELAGHKCSSF